MKHGSIEAHPCLPGYVATAYACRCVGLEYPILFQFAHSSYLIVEEVKLI